MSNISKLLSENTPYAPIIAHSSSTAELLNTNTRSGKTRLKKIEDQIDNKLSEILNKFEQINNYIETEKNILRQPRKIVDPE